MARDRNEMVFKPVPAAADMKRPAHQVLGVWDGDAFAFHSPQDEQAWRSQAYRQSVHPEKWQTQAPVDGQTQAVLDGMPELGDGRFYRGPDGKHRHRTMDQREDAEVHAIRQIAFNDFAKTGVTWAELAAYDDDKPHPGEEEAVAVSQSKAGTAAIGKSSTESNKARDMGALPANSNTITQVAGDLGLGLDQLADPWDEGSAVKMPQDVLVADSGKAVPAGLPKGWVNEASFGAPKWPTLTTKERRAFAESLVGHPGNTNIKAPSESNVTGQMPPSTAVKPRTGVGMTTEEVAEAEYMNGLFNWQRQGKPAPAPKEYAIHAITDEGRFSYLEEKKDVWSGLVEAEPEEVLISMQGEVENLSVAAQRDFFTAHHREPTAQELAEINDTVEKVVFAPAEHWKEPTTSPDEPGNKVAPKPFIALERPKTLSGSELGDLFEQAAATIAQEPEERVVGRLGNGTNRKDIALIAEKLAAAIKACGGNVKAELYGRKEPQVQYVRGQVAQSRYPDVGMPFEMNGRTVSPFITHHDIKADGITMTTREGNQLQGLVINLARAIYQGDLSIDAAGIGAIPKRKKNQTDEEYHKMIDDLIKKMIDCRRPFLIKLDIDPLDIASDLE